MKRCLVLLLAVLLALANEGLAQQGAQKEVSGVITDASDGTTLPGVNIIVKGTTRGTATNAEGWYSLRVPSDATLVFTYMGYKAKEVVVGNQTSIDVAMEPQALSMDELVVVGYGSKKKRDLTGSIVSVSSSELEKSQVNNPLSVLQGRAAGVQITSNSGAPGGDITFRVRGNSSLNSGNSPLYVIDGVPVESNSLSSLNVSEQHGVNPLASINPGDIESIEVLKDASSTAIYGSRAANGVVMITTKQGAEGKAKISLNLNSGVSNLSHWLGVLNAEQYRDWIIDSYQNMDEPVAPTWAVLDSLSPRNNGDIDWQDELYRSAMQYKAELSILGGTDKINYAFSASYLDQDGIILNSNFTNITSRMNIDFKVNERLEIGQRIFYAHGVNNRINAAGTGNLSIVRSALYRPPTYSMYLPDGSLNGYQWGKRNPVGLATLCTHLNTSDRIIGNEYLEYEIIEGLKFRANLSIDVISMKEDWFMPSTLDYREGFNWGSVRSTNNLTWANEDYLSYDKTIGDNHSIGAVLGISFQDWRYEVTGLDGKYFISDDIRSLNGAATIENQEVNVETAHSMQSFFGRVSYDFQKRYLFEASMRADGSSRFGSDNRYGFFPSVSFAWRFSDEAFLQNLGFLNDAKLRFGVGSTGNEAIGNYTSRGRFSVGNNYLDYSGAAPTVMPNSALSWETTTQYNAGLDLSVIDNRVFFIVDVYYKHTKDLLYNVPIPRTTGFSYITQNLGEIENKGVEFALTTHNFTGKFQWNTNFNISFNRNKILDLPEELLTNGYIQDGPYHILQVGSPIGVFYGYKFEGVYARDEDNVNLVRNGEYGDVFEGGEPIWNDLNEDNIIDEKDKQIIGNAQPDFFGGISNSFSYKNLSLDVFFQYSYGNEIYSEIKHQTNSVVRYNNPSREALKRWRKQGDVTDFPKPVREDPMESDSRVQSRWVEDGSYIKLKNVSLRYQLPRSLVQRIRFDRIEVYCSGSNLLTWTHYTGYDPDVNSYRGLRIGVDEGSYPQSRTFIFGVKFGF